jgi:hypothetical protein
MTPAVFLLSLEQELQLLGVPHDRGELLAWIADAWPLIEDAPDVGRWAREYAQVKVENDSGS